jgi:stage II sporulation protein D
VGRALGWDLLPGTWFEIRDAGDRLVFLGRGRGHGVGLCQTGAARMGETGQTSAQILQFYFPGTELGVSAKGFDWQALAGEQVEVFTMRPREDARVVGLADRMAREAQERAAARFSTRPQIRIFPSVEAFRDATGEAGWVAASTRGRVVRVQPVSLLGDALAATLRHELLHILVEARARTNLPLWFREGLVLYLAEPAKPRGPERVEDRDIAQAQSRADLDRAYQAARSRVAGLAARYGKETVLGWLSSGLPPGR